MFIAVLIILAIITAVIFLKSRIVISIYGSPYPAEGDIKIYIFNIIPYVIKFKAKKNRALLFVSKKKKKKKSIKELIQNKVIRNAIKLHSIKIIIREGLKSDPVMTALVYGVINALLSLLYIPIHKLNNKCLFDYKVYPYFNSNKICFSVYCIINVRIADIIFAAIKYRLRSAENG